MHQDFLNLLVSHGYSKPTGILKYNDVVRIKDPHDKGLKKSGWLYYHQLEEFDIATFGSWRDDFKVTWCSREVETFTTAERIIYNERIKEQQKKREAQLALDQEEARRESLAIWNSSVPALTTHPYISRKGVMIANGVRESRGALVIPVMDEQGISSLQFIQPDGSKKFKSGGKVKGGWFCIPGNIETVYIAEGYATAASVNMATEATVYVAFNAGNLLDVVSYVKLTHPHSRIVIAGDDDQFGKENAGRDKASKAAVELCVEVVFPVFSNIDTKPVDFNDLHALEGLQRVTEVLTKQPKLYKAKKEERGDSTLFNPPGMIGKIVDYYNATSGYNQPGFAVQTALALGSLVCARNFETSNANRSTLFLMIVGKSTTGKDHTKEVIEDILAASDCTDLIGGEGYTSQAAVIEALRTKPRHITIIDEFSKHMRASQNKNSNANLAEANTCLMKVISSPRSALRPKEYSNRNLSEEKKEELNKPIMSPSITLMAMSVPDDLFGSIDIGSIKDGFWNRFVICVSDAQRSVRIAKPRMAAPAEIIEWVKMINVRRPYLMKNEQPHEQPAVNYLEITPQAMTIYQEFNAYQIEKSNSLDKFQLGDLVGRASEMALRISLIIALGRNAGSVVVDVEDIAWAVEWVKYNMNILVDKLKMSVSGSEFESSKLEFLKTIRDAGAMGISDKEMRKRKPFSRYTPKQRAEIIGDLFDAEVIASVKRQTGGRGQPPNVWIAIEGE